jgi:malonate decarboxylase delta subunit
MEHLEYEFDGSVDLPESAKNYSVAGVVTSGNLEVMMKKEDLKGKSKFEIDTAAEGFENIWKAVLEDFMERTKISGISVSINDNAASPPVVSLRLDQAFEDLKGESTK